MENSNISYIKEPMKIETESFRIIQEIINEEHSGYKFKDDFEETIIKRVVHTSADFEYLKNLKISENFKEEILGALKRKATIYTDTNMALSGINKSALAKLGISAKCYISDKETAEIAKKEGITRSMASVKRMIKEDTEKILVVGNAPTFLFQAIEEMNENTNISAIIGVPVGFVGAVESKDLLANQKIAHIAALGRKGGSNVAAAIVNAVIYYLAGRD
ncbi:precorrin-8X/cobalt-precorrin-8 methylmutase [Acetoanaerobium pronyense]|uniref:Precorrin-8X/cobalt-precorrin-8 methylmutase n=1 Tax=Acetoanaerobium pronyense TaxID=1482736 RepID=A0ABS4KIT0_9FIRM|nr:precorrin-8X/cobalt-precorrin-8 methylmutase [Acetoanaerobium pronyense]